MELAEVSVDILAVASVVESAEDTQVVESAVVIQVILVAESVVTQVVESVVIQAVDKEDLAEAIISQVKLQLKDTKGNCKPVKHNNQLSMIVTEEQMLITLQECKVKLVALLVAAVDMVTVVTEQADKALTDMVEFLMVQVT